VARDVGFHLIVRTEAIALASDALVLVKLVRAVRRHRRPLVGEIPVALEHTMAYRFEPRVAQRAAAAAHVPFADVARARGDD